MDPKLTLLAAIVDLHNNADRDYFVKKVDPVLQELLDLGWVRHTNPIGPVGIRPTAAGRAELERLGIQA